MQTVLREVFQEEIGAMPYAYVPRSLALVHHWGEPFDEAKWQRLTERVCFHKLTYMKDIVPVKVEGTYHEFILNNNGNKRYINYSISKFCEFFTKTENKNHLYGNFVVSLHRHLISNKDDSGIQNQELLLFAG